MRGRLLESFTIVLGVALGVGVISATLALARTAGVSQTSGREARIIRVGLPDPEEVRDTPVRTVGAGPISTEGYLSLGDIEAAKAACADVELGWFDLFVVEPTEAGAQTRLPTVAAVAGDYFAAFGLEAAEGILFSPEDQAAGARVAVVGSARAARHPGGALGSTLTVSGLEYTIVGVLEPVSMQDPGPQSGGTQVGLAADSLVFVPVRSTVAFENLKRVARLSFMARSPESVRLAVQQLSDYFASRLGQGAVEVRPALGASEREAAETRAVIGVLLTFAGAGLLIASINILNVLLARGARRVRSTGVSVALGASRREVFRMYLLESLVLGSTGCALGVPLGVLLTWFIRMLFSSGQGNDPEVVLTAGGLAVSTALALGLNLLFAMYPAWRAARMNPADAVRAD